MKAIRNGRCIVPGAAGAFEVVDGQVLLYDADGIAGLMPEADFAAGDAIAAEEVIDAGGRYVAPGFLNVHIHGCKGSDTMDATQEALGAMQAFLPRTGVTAFLPTTMTCAWQEIAAALTAVRTAMQTPRVGAQVLGAHMEGPFISPAKKGSQAEENILRADYARLAPFADVVRIVTLAPEELPEGSDFLARCRAAGIHVSIGHTAADYETARRAVLMGGAHRFTHLYDAMQGFHHRAPGTLGAAFDTDAYVELIADNVHATPMAQRLAYRVKGRDRVILITDALRACGLGDGPSELGGQRVFVQGERATLADGTIAGSVATMNRCLRLFLENTGASVADAVAMVTKNPAEDLGIYGERGSLTPGKRADITIFDEQIAVYDTIIGGRRLGPFA
ncbi:N-acetylglucosamine-6-phosphate deacetylase [uncultured Selenomonas sp.]|uniref:N-acetylglucosamine-6-phosphate deacetylase n=1 Tax=uncultured Selenomonas sp. TaxID=159275 RepID=UPI002806284B|nr:N-acetylglucosamine-6-phosphate deacetylase [uncultured Selenomonas sp.]